MIAEIESVRKALEGAARSARPLLTATFTVGFVEDLCRSHREQQAEIERLRALALLAYRHYEDAVSPFDLGAWERALQEAAEAAEEE